MSKEEYSPLMSEDGFVGEENAARRIGSATSSRLRKYLPTYGGLLVIVIVESLLLVAGAGFFLAKASPGVYSKNDRVLYCKSLT